MSTVLFANCKGGTGKSLVCALTARALAASGRNVTIVDADPFTPAIALACGSEGATGTLVEVCEKLRCWTIPHEESDVSDWPKPEPEGLRLIDSAPGMGAATCRAMAESDRLVLVVCPEPVALLGALRAARYAVGLRPDVSIGLVVNRCPGPGLAAHVAGRFDAALGRFLSTGLDWSLAVGELPKAQRQALRRSVATAVPLPKSVSALAEKLDTWKPSNATREEVTILRPATEPKLAA